MGNGFIEKVFQQIVCCHRQSENDQVNNQLNASVSLSACYGLVQRYGLFVVNSQLERTEVIESYGIESPCKCFQQCDFSGKEALA